MLSEDHLAAQGQAMPAPLFKGVNPIRCGTWVAATFAVLLNAACAGPTTGEARTPTPPVIDSAVDLVPSAGTTPVPTPEPTALPILSSQSDGYTWLFEDQETLLFVHERKLCLQAGDESTYLADAGMFTGVIGYSPDDEYLLWATTPDVYEHQIWIARADGSESRVVVKLEDVVSDELRTDGLTVFGEIMWLPGLPRVAFTIRNFNVTTGAVYVFDVEREELLELVPPDDTFPPLSLRPSPDGAWLALVGNDSVDFIRTDGTDYTPDVLTFAPRVSESDMHAIIFPGSEWADDGSGITVRIPTGRVLRDDGSLGEEEARAWFVPLNGSPYETAAPSVDSGSYFQSPDGAYEVRYGTGSNSLYVTATDGSSDLLLWEVEAGSGKSIRHEGWQDDRSLRFSVWTQFDCDAACGPSRWRYEPSYFVATVDGTVSPDMARAIPQVPCTS